MVAVGTYNKTTPTLQQKTADIRRNLLRNKQKALSLQKKTADIRKNLTRHGHK